jgi:hypothetical protein
VYGFGRDEPNLSINSNTTFNECFSPVIVMSSLGKEGALSFCVLPG